MESKLKRDNLCLDVLHVRGISRRRQLSGLLTTHQIAVLRGALQGRVLACSFGAGVDSTAMIVAMWLAGIVPDVLTFADTGGERPETLAHIPAMNRVLQAWGWPVIETCKKVPLPSTGYTDLYGNCYKNQTLPSLAFGLKSCSIKWKGLVQDQYLMGVTKGPNKAAPHPVWIRARNEGVKILKLIGYDAGPADKRRSAKPPPSDSVFDYCYPLQLIGWTRADCVNAIACVLGQSLIPEKSACFFCPATKAWELFWMAAHHPELLEAALQLERNALTGRHSRFDEIEFGATWEEMVNTADSFPSTATTVGLGRSFAWNQWARVNNVVDEHFAVKRGVDDKAMFLERSAKIRGAGLDNANDKRRIIHLSPV